MALAKLPTLREVMDDPSVLASLPTPQLLEIKEQFAQLERELGGAENAADSPLACALKHPKYHWMNARHIEFLSDKISECIYRSKEHGDHTGLVITMPPRHAKSHTASVWTPFWHLTKYPDDSVILIARDATMAAKWGAKVRDLVSLHGAEYNLKLNPKKVARNDWELTTGGGMRTFGVGGVIAGNPAKLLILDDVVSNDEQARSDYQRETMWDWWDGTAMQRIEPDTTTLVIGTRYHEDDIIGRLLQHSTAGDGLEVELLSLAAKALDDDPLGRAPGEGLWLEHFDQRFYDKREIAVSPYVWSSVYQQTPTAPGGNMVDQAWWRFYRPTELPRTKSKGCQTWDISLDADKKTDSRHAGLVMEQHDAMIYIRDGFAEHCDINKVITTLRTWAALFPHCRTKLIERATAGVTLQQTLRRSSPGVLAWPPKGKQKGSKEACLDAIIPAIRSGNVLLPVNADGSKPRWVSDLIEETRTFPRGTYDDLVDALSQGVGFLLPGMEGAISRAHDDALAERVIMTPQEVHTQVLNTLINRFASKKLQSLKNHIQQEGNSVIPFPLGHHQSTPSSRPMQLRMGGRRRILC